MPWPTTRRTSPRSRSRCGCGTPGSTASRTCRPSTPEGVGRTSDDGPLGENQRAVDRDGHRVLHVGPAGAVLAAQRPPVVVGVDLVGGVQEPRLDGDDQPGAELEAAPGTSVV